MHLSSTQKERGHERIVYPDVLRLMATLGVIAIHVAVTGYYGAVGTCNWYVAAVGDSFVRWAVPIFVMISGVLFLNPNKKIATKDIVLKYVKRLFISYIFWWLAYAAFGIIFDSLRIGALVFKIGYFSPYLHLWFLPMLMGVYLLMPLLRKIACEKKLLQYSLVLWLGYLTVSFCMEWPNARISKLFVMNTIIGYSGYFFLGYYFSQYGFVRSQCVTCVLGIIGLVVTIAGSIMLSQYRGVCDDKFFDNLSPHIVMMATALFMLVKNKITIANKVKRFVDSVRKDLFGIYLTHCIWLIVFDHVLFFDIGNHMVALPVFVVAVFVLSLLTTRLIRMVPYLRKVVE